jgi:hypothetical protein
MRASFTRWIRKSIPALRGSGLINDGWMIVVLRNTTLACHCQFRTTPENKSLARGWIFYMKESNFHATYKRLYKTVWRTWLWKELGWSQRITTFPPKFCCEPPAGQTFGMQATSKRLYTRVSLGRIPFFLSLYSGFRERVVTHLELFPKNSEAVTVSLT